MADEEDAALLRGPQSLHQVQDLRLDGHVERGGRLVEEEERGVASQRRGDQGPLLHAPAELVRIGAGHGIGARDPDLYQELASGPERLATREPPVMHQGLGDLEPDPECGVQRGERVLEDHPDPVAP